MKIKQYLILFVFAFYWVMTIFFTMPKNYIQIQSYNYKQLFSTYFYQEWAFFAPPPTSNDNLYYQFVKKGDTLLVNAIKPVLKAKKEKFLKNDNETIIEYILSNTISTLSKRFREDYKIYEYKFCDNIDKDICLSNFLKNGNEKNENSNEILTLKNYGNIVHQKLSKKYSKFRILYSATPIEKFATANKQKSEETLLFVSNYYTIQK